LTNFLKNNKIYLLHFILKYNSKTMPKRLDGPNDDLEEEKENESSESFEDLLDNEYEENLDEYGDGNEEAAWKDSAEDEDSELDKELDDQDI
jgi:hypothetical protein